MKFIIYSKKTGLVWRDLDQYIIESDGTIFGGVNGVNTLRYPPSIKPAIIEISEAEFAALDENLGRYSVIDGQLIMTEFEISDSEALAIIRGDAQ